MDTGNVTDRPLRVLLVEDSQTDAELIVAELRRAGYRLRFDRVDTAGALRDALGREAWDILLSDHSFPAFSSSEALALVRERDADVPFVIVSGSIGEEAVVNAMRAGAQDFVSKSNLSRLAPVVERELRQRDVGRQHRIARQALAEAERRFHVFMDTIPAAAWIKDETLRYAYINRPLERVAGRSLAEVQGKDDFMLWPEEVARRLRENDLRAMVSGQVLETLETLPDADGQPRTFMVLKFALPESAGKSYVGGLAVDITDRKQTEDDLKEANQRLQVLSRRILEIQEQERRRIARELHDEIGQALTAIKLSLQGVTKRSDATPIRDFLRESVRISDQALEQVRTLALDLRPAQLDDLGLVPALRALLDRQAGLAGFAGSFAADPLPARLASELETACLRIAQEALTNVARHARASHVRLELWCRDGNLHLTVRDDGRGFHASERNKNRPQSLGILGMEERATLAGGQLDISSEPGKGTEIHAVFPLSPASEGAQPEAVGR